MTKQKSNTHSRRVAFVWLCVICVTAAGSYFLFARHRTSLQKVSPVDEPSVSTVSPQLPATTQPARRIPTRRLLFCDLSTNAHQGRLATVDLNGPREHELHFYDQLVCMRADFRGGNGICLHMNLNNPLSPNEAVIFDKEFRIKHVIPLAGVASRTRVSPNGEWGAVTVFTGVNSYASSRMSTKTTVIDIQTGTTLFDLEDLVVRNKGVVFKQPDFNFWGVTFTKDSRYFYATLSTGGRIYLIKANLATLQADVICENIECPSLSPDNARIAFKKRSLSGKRPTWHLAVLNLATLKETLLPEPEPIDQQVQWYDNHHVMYALPEFIVGKPVIMYTKIIAADGSSPFKKLLSNADSPVIFHEAY